MIDGFNFPPKADFNVLLCILSLAVCLCHQKQSKEANEYFGYLAEDPSLLMHPIETVDYTLWHQELSKDNTVPRKLKYESVKKIMRTVVLREPRSLHLLG
jgi:hypothetical protein